VEIKFRAPRAIDATLSPCDRDGLLVFFVGVIWFGAAAAVIFFTIVVVPTSAGVGA
jgi:hypothetical protein